MLKKFEYTQNKFCVIRWTRHNRDILMKLFVVDHHDYSVE